MITTIDMGCYRSSANSGRQAQKADRTCATIGPSNDRPWGPHEEAHQAGDGLLHPTQVTAGMLEVEEKRKHFQPLSGDDLRRAIKALPMPAVLGRDGKHFIIDHHHLGRALWDARIDYAYVDVVSDFSKLATEAFWSEMALKRWVHPYDEQGILHGIAAIPGHVSGLVDDPFRSLAAFVRDAGGYAKTPEPFADFQ